MSSLKWLSLTLLLSFVSKAHSYSFIGKVINLRGEVSQLRPGEMQARKVSINDELREDTSLLTGRRSMVIVRMNDRSVITLGPESKLVLVDAPTSEEPGIISLLNGHLRSQIQKQNNNDKETKTHKQIISTRSAAMGVRGTDFILAHNSTNHVSSLVTLEGSVEMAKIDESFIESLEEQLAEKKRSLQVQRYDGENIEYRRLSPPRLSYSQRLKVALQKDPKIVEAGHYSGSVEKLDVISEPTRISPQQFAALYKNTELQAQEGYSIDNLKQSEDFLLPRGLRYASSSTPGLGFLDRKNKKYAPKAGGYLDLKTALYIAPEQEAVFNERYNLFDPLLTNSGGVNPNTGEYIPPKGIILDQKKGFVVSSRVKNQAEKQRLENETKKLNIQAASHIVMKGPEKNRPQLLQLYSARELMTKNNLKVSLNIYNQDISYDSSAEKLNFSTQHGTKLDMMMSHSSGRSWQILTGLRYKRINFGENSFRQDDRNLFGVQLGARRYLTSRLHAVGHVGLEQDHFIEEIENEKTLSVINSTRLSLGLEWEAIKSNRWSWHLDGSVIPIFSKTTRNLETKTSVGLELKTYINYWFSQKSAIEFGPRFFSVSQDQINPLSDAKLDRDESGLFLAYKRVF